MFQDSDSSANGGFDAQVASRNWKVLLLHCRSGILSRNHSNLFRIESLLGCFRATTTTPECLGNCNCSSILEMMRTCHPTAIKNAERHSKVRGQWIELAPHNWHLDLDRVHGLQMQMEAFRLRIPLEIFYLDHNRIGYNRIRQSRGANINTISVGDPKSFAQRDRNISLTIKSPRQPD